MAQHHTLPYIIGFGTVIAACGRKFGQSHLYSHCHFAVPLKNMAKHTVDGSEIRLTTWDVKNLVNSGINYLSTGAGFLPSTLFQFKRLLILQEPLVGGIQASKYISF